MTCLVPETLPVHAGTGPCTKCSCSKFSGKGNICENCRHHYDDHSIGWLKHREILAPSRPSRSPAVRRPALQLRQQLIQLELRKELRTAPGVRFHPFAPYARRSTGSVPAAAVAGNGRLVSGP
jgi:hypothetical protein